MKQPKLQSSESLTLLVGALAALFVMISCGGGTPVNLRSTTASATTTLSDPPTCKAPAADFNQIWVTVTRVRAHLSNTAGPNDSGWVDLVDLRSSPKQIDLLNISDTTCFLTTLGSATGLQPGTYQQIRMHLLSNTPASGEATPSPNNCGNLGFNCLQLKDGRFQTLLLSSEATTGIKIPPGQIAGGGISLEAGQSSDINIEFNACSSLVRQGNGQFRLKPTLHAGEVSLATNTINGRVVDNTTRNPIPNARIFVLAEQPDSDGIDRVVIQTVAQPLQGTFILCPLPAGNYDVVVAAVSASGVTYNASVTLNVPVGTSMGDIPLTPETGANTAPGEIRGTITTTTSANQATGADIALSALEDATPMTGTAVRVTVPLLGTSTQNVPTEITGGCAPGTKCAAYSLFVPASNPTVGTFSTSGTTYTTPATGDVLYRVNARAFLPGSGSTTPNDCSPSSLTTNLDSSGSPLKVTAGTFTTAQTLTFTGCEAGF